MLDMQAPQSTVGRRRRRPNNPAFGKALSLHVIQYPHPTLRHPSRPLKRVDAELRKIVAEMIELMYREQGFFTGRELYFLDPSGNVLEIRDPTWQTGMPKPTFEELASR